MFSDLHLEATEKEDYMVTLYQCPECKYNYEVQDISEGEQEFRPALISRIELFKRDDEEEE